ncbi:MAG: IS5 family transposase [Prolixibacteraceae bacterium]
MIEYTPQSQLSLELFRHPFEQALDKENRWVKLASLIPWDSLAAVYCRKLDAGTGRKSVNIRTVIAALIVKHKLRLDDRGTVEMIQGNIYLQYFCGLKCFTTAPVFDPSLFVDIRKRLGGNEFDAFNRLVIEKSEELKPHQSRIKKKESREKSPEDESGEDKKPGNRGTLKADATVADQEITYPTDLKLLNAARENLERMIDLVYLPCLDGTKPRDYRRLARKDFLNVAKKKWKTSKEVRRGIKVQLQYVARDMKIIGRLLSKPGRTELVGKRDKKLLSAIGQVYVQQRAMYDNKTHQCQNRIVNLFQPHVRPIVRGKDKNKVEFGAKVNISEVNGFCRVGRLSWEAYNESVDMKMQVENYKQTYGCYPKVFLGDQIFLTRENRKYMKEKGIEIYGKPLGRPPVQNAQTPIQRYRKKKKAAQRNHVEGKFGQGKRGYGLNRIMVRLSETSESWINAIFFIMNLVKLLQVAEKWKGSFAFSLNAVKMHLKDWFGLLLSGKHFRPIQNIRFSYR